MIRLHNGLGEDVKEARDDGGGLTVIILNAEKNESFTAENVPARRDCHLLDRLWYWPPAFNYFSAGN